MKDGVSEKKMNRKKRRISIFFLSVLNSYSKLELCLCALCVQTDMQKEKSALIEILFTELHRLLIGSLWGLEVGLQ